MNMSRSNGQLLSLYNSVTESNCIFKKTDILHQVYVHNTKHPKKKKKLGSISEAMSVTYFILSAK